jgi:hypothetical protein
MHTTQNFLIYKHIENNIQQKLPDQMNEAISLSNKRKGLLLEGFLFFSCLQNMSLSTGMSNTNLQI